MSRYQEALNYIPGGVNSPVRAFKSVDRDPIFIKKAKGSYLYDEDGNKYLDFINSWGPSILGHSNDKLIEKAKAYLEDGLTYGLPTDIEIRMAKTICEATDCDMVRMVNSGTEATMSAIRLARGFTGRDKFIKFEGCYHGHSDGLLVKSGSGALTLNIPTSKGIPNSILGDTIVCEYNNIDSVKEAIEENKDEISCVILEPIAGNMGVVPSSKEFIKELRSITKENGIILIFDEVITGFRCRYGSIKYDFGIEADLYCFGKIIGGGLPVGAFGGRREIMNHLAPIGEVYQAGTLSGNPLVMKMGLDVLDTLRETDCIYERLEENAMKIQKGFEKNIREIGVKAKVTRHRSMMCLFFGDFDEIKSYEDVKKADTAMYAKYFSMMMDKGIIIAPSQFEAMFMSYSHKDEDIDYLIQCNREVLEKL